MANRNNQSDLGRLVLRLALGILVLMHGIAKLRGGVGPIEGMLEGAGLPGFNPVQDYVDYDVRTHHTNADTFERVREQDLKQGAIILARALDRPAVFDRAMAQLRLRLDRRPNSP